MPIKAICTKGRMQIEFNLKADTIPQAVAEKEVLRTLEKRDARWFHLKARNRHEVKYERY